MVRSRSCPKSSLHGTPSTSRRPTARIATAASRRRARSPCRVGNAHSRRRARPGARGSSHHDPGSPHDAGFAARHGLRDAARRARQGRGAGRARTQQALSARRGRPPRQPEIRTRYSLPDRRSIRGGGANREAAANPTGAARSRGRAGRGGMTMRPDAQTLADPVDTPAPAGSAPDASTPDTPAAETSQPRPGQRRRPKRDVNGWLVLDKPVGMTSTHAVSVVKRLFQAKRAGHAGTLDPLASGCLPIALGEATKTVPFVMDGRKTYHFTVQWGEERDTDDAEGRVVAASAARPDPEAIRALLPRFTGTIAQVPPRFSALKIEGERAYDLAREGKVVELAARPVDIHCLELVAMPDAAHTVLAAECGKGTYVRALARDLGRELGCLGHVVALRRTAVGSFTEDCAVTLDALQAACRAAPEQGATAGLLLPVEAGLAALPALVVSRADAGRLARGQTVLLRGRDAPMMEGWVAVSAQGSLVALAEMEQGELRPRRIFNLAR